MLECRGGFGIALKSDSLLRVKLASLTVLALKMHRWSTNPQAARN